MTRHKKSPRLTSRFIRAIGDKIAPRGKGQGRLFIINYHRVLKSQDPFLESEPDVGSFRWQMELLAGCFNVMPLHDAIAALATQRMPPRAVCITFDDGYRSVHDLALPVLKEFGLPATVFVTTGCMNESNMWNDRIMESIRCLPDRQLDLRETGLGCYSLATLSERKHAVDRVMEEAKYLSPHARFEVIQKLENLAGSPLSQGLMLTREMIAALARKGVEIGGHTISHPILTRLDDETARHEITGCKQQLEAIIGKPVRLFAYPNGKIGTDFNERHVRMAKDAGFVAAFTTASGAATSAHDRYAMPRGRPWDKTPFLYGIRLLRWLAGKGNHMKRFHS